MRSMAKFRKASAFFLGLLIVIALVVACGNASPSPITKATPTPTLNALEQTIIAGPPTVTPTETVASQTVTPNVDISAGSNGKPVFNPTDISFTRSQSQNADFTINNSTTSDLVIFTTGTKESINVTNSSDGSSIPAATISVNGVDSTIYTIPAATTVNITLANMVETHIYLTANGFNTEKEYTSKLTIHPSS